MADKVLVTGGAGAIGSNVVRGLLKAGHEVVVMDDLSSGHQSLVPTGATFVKGTVESEKDVEGAFRHGIGFVIHMAALFANQNSVEHPDRDLLVNGLGTINILKGAVAHNVKKVVYTSSSCVYGNKPLMAESDIDFGLDTPYAITKLLGEHYCRFWVDHYGLDIAMVRLFNTYGPGEYPGRYRNVIPNFMKLAMAKQPLTVTGTGDETRDFNFTEDTADGIIRALFEKTAKGDVFNLASGKPTKIRDLAELINQLADNPAGITYVPRRDWDHVASRCASIEKARRVLQYGPRVPLELGLKRTFDWFLEYVR